ncbi:uncharacterized protein LOC120348613 [Styela clava]
MGNECSVIRGGNTEATLSSLTGTIASATNYDDDEECKWSFNPNGLQTDVMTIAVTSTNVECDKASFKIHGNQYCDKTNSFCLIFDRGNCNGNYNPHQCHITNIDSFPSIQFRGKDDARNKGFSLTYTFTNCDKLTEPTTTTAYIPTTTFTSTEDDSTALGTFTQSLTSIKPLNFTSQYFEHNTSVITSQPETTIGIEPTTASSTGSTIVAGQLNIIVILLPILIVIFLLAFILLIVLCMRRRTAKKYLNNTPHLTTTIGEDYVAADDIINGQRNTTMDFDQSYETIPQGRSQPDIVPIYSVVEKSPGVVDSSQSYETITFPNKNVEVNNPTFKNMQNHVSRPTAVYSVVRKKPKSSGRNIIISSHIPDTIVESNNENQYVAAGDVLDKLAEQSYEEVAIGTARENHSAFDKPELYSVVTPMPKNAIDEEGVTYDNPSFMEDEYKSIDGGNTDNFSDSVYNRLSRC